MIYSLESLATVEGASFASSFDFKSLSSYFEDPVHGYTFSMAFRNSKILRVSSRIEQEIGFIPGDEELHFIRAFKLDILPSLEEIELNASYVTAPLCTPIRVDENQVTSVLEPYKPFVDAPEQASYLAEVHWNTDRRYFCDTDM